MYTCTTLRCGDNRVRFHVSRTPPPPSPSRSRGIHTHTHASCSNSRITGNFTKAAVEGENNESYALTDVCRRFVCRVTPTRGGGFSYSHGRNSTEIIGYDDVYYSGILYRWRNIAHTLLCRYVMPQWQENVEEEKTAANESASDHSRFHSRIIALCVRLPVHMCVCMRARAHPRALIPMRAIFQYWEGNTRSKVHSVMCNTRCH